MAEKDAIPLTSTSDRPPKSERRFGMLEHLVMSAYWFGSNFAWGALLGVVLPKQVEIMAPGQKAAVLGLLVTVGAIPALVVPLIAGALSDRCTHPAGRRRPFIAWGTLGAFVGLMVMLLAFMGLGAKGSHLIPSGEIRLYFAGYFLIQFGANTALAAYMGVIPDLVPHDQRGVASGFMALMSQLGTLLGVVISAWLVEAHPVPLFAITSLVLISLTGVTLFGVKEKRLEAAEPIDWPAYFRGIVAPLLHRDFLWVWITRAFMMLGFYAILPNIQYFLGDVIRLADPVGQAGKMIGVILICATISGYVGGALSDRVGRKLLVYASCAIIAVTSIGFAFSTATWEVWTLGVVFGFGYGAYISVDWALGTDVLPSKEDAGNDMAVWHVSMTLPQSIGPVLAGGLLTLFREQSSAGQAAHYGQMGYGLVFGFAAVCFAAAGYFLRNVKGAR